MSVETSVEPSDESVDASLVVAEAQAERKSAPAVTNATQRRESFRLEMVFI